MVQLVNNRVMALIILGIMVLCGAPIKAIGITAIVLGVVRVIGGTLLPKAIINI